MFATSLLTVIQEIHSLFNAATGLNVQPELGNIEKAAHGTTPRIVWTFTGGRSGLPTRIGGTHTATANFEIWVWFNDLDGAWNASNALLSAIRQTVYGQQPFESDYAVPTETDGRHMEFGAVLLFSVALNIEIDALDTSAWVPLTGATFELGMGSPYGVVLDDETVATTEDAVLGSVPLA